MKQTGDLRNSFGKLIKSLNLINYPTFNITPSRFFFSVIKIINYRIT